MKGVEGRGSLRCGNYPRSGRCKFVSYCFCSPKGTGRDPRAQAVRPTRRHRNHPSSITEMHRGRGSLSQKKKNNEGAEEAPAALHRHLLPLRRPNTKSILHTPKWLFRKVFFPALERLTGKLKAADTRGDATFRFAY